MSNEDRVYGLRKNFYKWRITEHCMALQLCPLRLHMMAYIATNLTDTIIIQKEEFSDESSEEWYYESKDSKEIVLMAKVSEMEYPKLKPEELHETPFIQEICRESVKASTSS